MKIIEKEWNDYLLNVMAKDASGVQVEETQKAFYAGAGCLFYALLGFLDEGTEATDADLAKMDALHREIDEFIGIEMEREST